MGQSARKPVDIMCIGKEDSKKSVTILEAKTDTAGMKDLIQSLKYLRFTRAEMRTKKTRLLKCQFAF